MRYFFKIREHASSSIARDAIAREELVGLSFMFWGRLTVLGLLAMWVVFVVSEERTGLYLSLIALFALLGALPYGLAQRGMGGTGTLVAFMILEAGVLSYLLIVPMPFEIDTWTQQMNLRLPGFLYLGVFLVSMGLSYSPALVLWAGAASVLCWSAGYVWVASLPGSTLMWPLDLLDEGVTSREFISRYLDPTVVRPNFFLNQVVFLSAVTVVLALTVWRSRALVHRVLSAEKDREAALVEQQFIKDTFGKFVPETVVREILRDRGQLAPRRRVATVLFADIEGFTKLSERLSPERLLSVLTQYFERAGAIITDHGGTITQLQGDALLASFNVPVEDADHAFHAVSAAQALVSMVEAETFDGERLGIRVGINTGDVAAGAVGGVDRLSYTVHGESVNIASRVEQLNKKTATQVLVTAHTADRLADRSLLTAVGAFEIRGVTGSLNLFTTR